MVSGTRVSWKGLVKWFSEMDLYTKVTGTIIRWAMENSYTLMVAIIKVLVYMGSGMVFVSIVMPKARLHSKSTKFTLTIKNSLITQNLFES